MTAMGHVCQINISRGGVPKIPIPVATVNQLGIVGDGHRYRYHGGPHKSLLLIAAEFIDVLRAEGWPVFYGALGENLTTRGLSYRDWRPGQCYAAGGIILELTTPRTPCATIEVYWPGIGKRIFDKGVKSLDPSSAHWGESGFYASVLRPGTIHLNAPITLCDAARFAIGKGAHPEEVRDAQPRDR